MKVRFKANAAQTCAIARRNEIVLVSPVFRLPRNRIIVDFSRSS